MKFLIQLQQYLLCFAFDALNQRQSVLIWNNSSVKIPSALSLDKLFIHLGYSPLSYLLSSLILSQIHFSTLYKLLEWA